MSNLQQATVTKLEVARRPRPKRSAAQRAASRRGWASGAVTLVALALTGMSLTHLASGVEIVTRCQDWEAWVTAGGIDLGFVTLELAKIATPARRLHWTVTTAIVGTIAASSTLNAFAFAAHAVGPVMPYVAAAIGAPIPLLVFVLFRAAVGLRAGA